jgi:large subunit ribosomal protein L6
MPVTLPRGVEVGVSETELRVKGPKGEMRVPLNSGALAATVADGAVRIERRSEEKPVKALHGLTRSLVANAVTGVTQGFSKRLEVFGVGYRAEVQGGRLVLNIGYSHPVVYEAPKGIELALEDGQGGSQARILVKGIDKQQVGQVAADIRLKRRPEPYKGKGIRYENEVIHWKAGKTAVS